MFLFLVTFSNDLFIPVPIVNIKVKEEPAIPAGVPTTEAYEAILNAPNDADKAATNGPWGTQKSFALCFLKI